MENNFLYQNKTYRTRRKELRNNATDAEKLLWIRLRKSQLGYKFTRQYSIGPYIVDFYCPQFRFAIELDGEVHNTENAKVYDKERNEYLNNHDIVTIRFWNNELFEDLGKVIEDIFKSIEQRSSSLSS
jgi:very-short-patch-repair endonuclease